MLLRVHGELSGEAVQVNESVIHHYHWLVDGEAELWPSTEQVTELQFSLLQAKEKKIFC